MTHVKILVLSAIATVSAAIGVAAYAADSNTAPIAAHSHRAHHRGAKEGGPFMHAVRQLDLTDDQRQRIRSMISADREQAKANRSAQRANLKALANPGDPGYADAVAAAKNAATTAIQNRSNLEVQIYGVLTPDQQAQLPKVLADMKARAEQRRAEWQQNAPKA